MKSMVVKKVMTAVLESYKRWTRSLPVYITAVLLQQVLPTHLPTWAVWHQAALYAEVWWTLTSVRIRAAWYI